MSRSILIALALLGTPSVSMAAPCHSHLSDQREPNLFSDGVAFLPKIEISEIEIKNIRKSLKKFSKFGQLAIGSGHNIDFGIKKGQLNRDGIERFNRSRKLEDVGLEALAKTIDSILLSIQKMTNREVLFPMLFSLTWGEKMVTWATPTVVHRPFLIGEDDRNKPYPIGPILSDWQVFHGLEEVYIMVTLDAPGLEVLTEKGEIFRASAAVPIVHSTKEGLLDRHTQAFPLTAIKWSPNQQRGINLEMIATIKGGEPLEF